jgi:hypothetical protein
MLMGPDMNTLSIARKRYDGFFGGREEVSLMKKKGEIEGIMGTAIICRATRQRSSKD